MGLQEAEWKGLDWTDPAPEKHKWRAFCEFGNGPSDSTKFREFLD